MQWTEALCEELALPQTYLDTAPDIIEPLARRIRLYRASQGRPVIIGICGAQGSGKTTLSRFLQGWLEQEMHLTAVALSIDDFYLGKAARKSLARTLHPLFATRGVPGTHDVTLGQEVLAALTAGTARKDLRLPRFDKARDDRVPPGQWPIVRTPVDIVLFEGWCVGARPQDEVQLQQPVNALERCEDTDGRWRQAVNECLADDYCHWFGQLDLLLMLRIPSFEKVYEWRGLQEQKLAEATGTPTAEQAKLKRFIMHYERLTRHMLDTMPSYADVIVDIDDEHRMTSLRDGTGGN